MSIKASQQSGHIHLIIIFVIVLIFGGVIVALRQYNANYEMQIRMRQLEERMLRVEEDIGAMRRRP